ncbi:MAG TPA: thermonuclease family protein [Xanthomonadales bacterium]|nr:thermonuclease family protein [Xanthomonadales bacterium]
MRIATTCRGIAAFLFAVVATSDFACAGDSLYGKIVSVGRADQVTLDYGPGRYELRLAGIESPRDTRAAAVARDFVADLVLEKNVRMRFLGRTEDGAMLVRLFTDEPDRGIREVNVELVRSGLVRRIDGADFKYDVLSKAESEARAARRGLWAGDR